MTNVVPLFGPKKAAPKDTPPEIDTTGLIVSITEWAEAQGIDVYTDVAFHIRVADLMAQLQIMANSSRSKLTA